MNFNIAVEGGTSVRLTTAGKYCDRDIVITATGGGIELPPLEDAVEGGAEDLVAGKKLYNDQGAVVVGTNPYEKTTTDTVVANQGTLLDQALAAIAGKAAGSGSGTVNLQGVAVFPKTELQMIEPDPGYDGFSEVYVMAEPNLIPENIKKDVVLYEGYDGYEIVGTYEGSGGGNSPYTKAVEFLWEAPSDIVAGSAVSIPHELGDVPDGFVITNVTLECSQTKSIVSGISFDRSMFHPLQGGYCALIPGFDNASNLALGYFMCANLSDICTASDIKFSIANLYGTLIIPKNKQYRVLVYKR